MLQRNVPHPLLKVAPMGYNAVNSIEREDPHAVLTARKPSSAYVVLDSRERYVNANPQQAIAQQQPITNFVLQKAQAMVPNYAKRLDINEIRFPWFIPNITPRNNFLEYTISDPSGVLVSLPGTIQMPTGFYTPYQIAAYITAQILALITANVGLGWNPAIAPEVQWVPTLGVFQFLAGSSYSPALYDLAIYAPGDLDTPNFVSTEYYLRPSLPLTMGIAPRQLSVVGTDIYLGDGIYQYTNATTCLYTNYIDILSPKLMRYTDAQDGGSGIKTSRNIVARLYCADEASLQIRDASGNVLNNMGFQPFTIHRQFDTPKSVKWDPDSFVGDLDIQLADQYGDILYEPSTSYPDFQITMLASED